MEGNRSFDDLVRSVKEPAQDYAKPVSKDALAYLLFSSGTTGPPKGEVFYACVRHSVHVYRLELLGVMVSHKNMMFSAMQGFVAGALNTAVTPVSSSPKPI